MVDTSFWAEESEPERIVFVRKQRMASWRHVSIGDKDFAPVTDSAFGIYETDNAVDRDVLWRRVGYTLGVPLQQVLRDWLLDELPFIEVRGAYLATTPDSPEVN